MAYDPLPVEVDPDAVTDRILARLVDRILGYVPREGALEVALAEEIGRESAATNARTADAAASALAAIGQSVHGLPAITGTAATLPVDFVVTPGGGTIPAGLTVVTTDDGGAEIPYTLPAALTFGPGELYPHAILRATLPGAQANTSAPPALLVVTSTVSVLSAAATAPATGGVDPETRDAYLSRLVDYLSLLRPGGVRAADLALLSRNTPGVGRALAVDLLDVTTGNSSSAKTVSVFPITAAGAPVGPAVAAALRANLEAVREVGLLIRVADPTYTALDVMITVGADTGADPALVRAAVTASVSAYLSPSTWGAPRTDPRAWNPAPTVRYTELIRAAGSADGVLFVDEVTIDGNTADVTLPGPAALPSPTTGGNPSVITVVVTS